MKARTSGRLAAPLLGGLLIAAAGCAPPIKRGAPPEPAPLPQPAPVLADQPTPASRPTTIVFREQRARELKRQADLAGALTQWRILRTMAPDDPGIQRELETVEALVRARVADGLEAAGAALRDGDTDSARDAYLRTLAIEPRNQEALEQLRTLEAEAVYSVQEARLEKIRARRARAAERKRTGQKTALHAENGNGQERDYRDTGISLFKAGDYQASILELKKYLGSFPDDQDALDVLREAEERLKKEGTTEAVPAAVRRSTSVEATRKEAESGPIPIPAPTPAAVTAADRQAAQEFYERGVRVSRQDIAAAIELWTQSLERDPGHVQARLRLDQARKIQQRLETIDRR